MEVLDGVAGVGLTVPPTPPLRTPLTGQVMSVEVPDERDIRIGSDLRTVTLPVNEVLVPRQRRHI